MKRIILFSLLMCLTSILLFAQNVTILPSGITPAQSGGLPSGAVVLKQDNTPLSGFTNIGNTLLNYQGWIGAIPEQTQNRNNPSWGSDGSKIFLWGGYSSSLAIPPNTGITYLNNGQIYDHSTGMWSIMAIPSTLGARENATISDVGSKLLIWGGNNASSTPFGDGQLYDITTNTWSNYAGNPPTPRTEHTATYLLGASYNKVLVWGGKDSGGGMNSGKAFNLSGLTWEATDMSIVGAPSPRYGHVAYFLDRPTPMNPRLLIWGGFSAPNSPLNNGGIYNGLGNSWVNDAETTALNSASAPNFDTNVGTAYNYTSKIFAVFGGVNNGTNFGGKYFDFNTDTWTSFGTSSVPALYKASGNFIGNRLVIYGGRVGSATGSPNTTVYTYDFDTNSWLSPHQAQPNVTPMLPSLQGIDYPFMTNYNGSQVIVMGSSGSASSIFNKQVGGVYAPLTNINYTLFKKN